MSGFISQQLSKLSETVENFTPKLFRYRAQDKDYNCTPTAYSNYVLWSTGWTFRDLGTYEFLFNTTPEDGTLEEAFEKTNLKKRAKFDVNLMSKVLKGGGSFILQFYDESDDSGDWHDAFFPMKMFGLYLGINVVAGKKYWIGTRKRLQQLIDNGRNRKDGRNLLWIAKK